MSAIQVAAALRDEAVTSRHETVTTNICHCYPLIGFQAGDVVLTQQAARLAVLFRIGFEQRAGVVDTVAVIVGLVAVYRVRAAVVGGYHLVAVGIKRGEGSLKARAIGPG